MEEEKHPWLALKSSNHHDRTRSDKKTERAYHLLRFLGTETIKNPPAFKQGVRVRREMLPPPPFTEEDKKLGLDKLEKLPNETLQQYRERKKNRARKLEDRWK